MAAPSTGVALAERVDIHKSCKSLENLLVVFNEYCEASGAVVALQRKLARALRETASLKVTGDIAVNAMNASAAIFDALSEVDSKFAKIADKEYESVSTDVKKWFKKLNKEERNHDDRVTSANAKIKQAGQNYEKKAKKKATDVSDEHARYINLISTLGPEISQEKYNHSLNVTQRHTATTYSVAACLSRLADSEWQKSCECVRRFSPTIGPLGQWKALCEGGWTGPVPSDLPNGDSGRQNPQGDDDKGGLKPIQEEPQSHPQPTAVSVAPEPSKVERPYAVPPEYSAGPPSTSASSQDLPRENISAQSLETPTMQSQETNSPPIEPHSGISTTRPNNLDPARPSFVDANTGSVRSLSAFPSPPTHFPIPPLRPNQPQRQQSSLSQSMTTSSSNLQFPSSNAVLADSPVSAHSELEDSFRTASQNFRTSNSSTSALNLSPPIKDNGVRFNGAEDGMGDASPTSASPSSPDDIRRPIPVKSQTFLPVESSHQRNRETQELESLSHRSSSSADLDSVIAKYHRSQYEEGNREFGVIDRIDDISSGKAKTTDNVKHPKTVERSDTVASNGSLVAAMRNRYSSNSGSTSPPPRDLPRIPLSVNDLASRYQPGDAPLSPRARASSPPVARQQSLPVLDTTARQAKDSYQEYIPLPSNRNNPSPNEERHLRQQQRNEELAIAERKAKEQELKEREQELEIRALELERERARLQSLREEESNISQSQSGQFGLRPRERRTSLRHQLQRPLSQMTIDNTPDDTSNVSAGPSTPHQKSRYAYSGNYLAPPLSPSTQPLASPKRSQYSPLPSPRIVEPMYESRSRDNYPENNKSITNSTSSHASNCGCESCSVSKYGASGKQSLEFQQRQAQPPEQGQHQRVDSKPDKPKSWMRRLSMPVGNAFGLDSSKKSQSSNPGSTIYNLGSGVGNTPVGGGRGLFSMDGKKNASTTALSSRSPDIHRGADRNPGVREDGRLGLQGRTDAISPGRRSYDVSGVSNRSMTNLGVMGRH